MVQLPVFDYLATFLDRGEVNVLVFVSRTFAPPDPRSLPERLLAMTRHANNAELEHECLQSNLWRLRVECERLASELRREENARFRRYDRENLRDEAMTAYWLTQLGYQERCMAEERALWAEERLRLSQPPVIAPPVSDSDDDV
jgi:hypothetical protein